jgi:hypothetical protein
MSNLPPHVAFFSRRSENFIGAGAEWRRATPEDDAHFRTGRDREGERHLGVYMVPRKNGMVRVGFDLLRLNLNLRPEIIERLWARWRAEGDSLSKSLLKSAERRSHFSKSFAAFEVSIHRLEQWKRELESILSNPDSYVTTETESRRG